MSDELSLLDLIFFGGNLLSRYELDQILLNQWQKSDKNSPWGNMDEGHSGWLIYKLDKGLLIQ